jgi:hypothetical protein
MPIIIQIYDLCFSLFPHCTVLLMNRVVVDDALGLSHGYPSSIDLLVVTAKRKAKLNGCSYILFFKYGIPSIWR